MKIRKTLSDRNPLLFAPLGGAVKGSEAELRLVNSEIEIWKQAELTNTEVIHITAVGENVFTDLGFDANEARELQADSRRVIADRLKSRDARQIKG